ncbi:hypothetical protein GCM10012275_63980 [Longimycelium tulufanense]|uniref:Uncharacterized protein n=1 Tax=Longimycelium tulufanense TaxID=907463 RepID=A0A8J3FYT0_9PSEU|nr:hypothetical protein [Longimycelium tulufanense]GGM84474.1 hypothetical protein GCM10012275_63980 [Longimycelium tulufanense]
MDRWDAWTTGLLGLLFVTAGVGFGVWLVARHLVWVIPPRWAARACLVLGWAGTCLAAGTGAVHLLAERPAVLALALWALLTVLLAVLAAATGASSGAPRWRGLASGHRWATAAAVAIPGTGLVGLLSSPDVVLLTKLVAPVFAVLTAAATALLRHPPADDDTTPAVPREFPRPAPVRDEEEPRHV